VPRLPNLANLKRERGAPQKYDWEKIGVAFGAWLHDQPGRDVLMPKDHEAAIADFALQLGFDVPGRSSIFEHLSRWLDAYKAFKAGN
jgi:hypothetical protein